jgi:O-antigen/teichoic acid export membrane protein
MWSQIKNQTRVLSVWTWEESTSDTASGDESGLKKKLLLDSVNYFLSKAIPGLMGFLSVLVFVRLVGTVQYGRYSVLFAIVTACTAGLSGWLPQGILRYFSMANTRYEEMHFKSATILGLLLSILIGSIVLGIALWFEKQPIWSDILGISLLAAGMLYGVFAIELQAMLRSGKVASIEAIRSASCLVVPICIIYLTGKRTANVLLAGVLVGYLLPLLVSQWRKQNQVPLLGLLRGTHTGENELKVLRIMWTYGWPVGLWSMCLASQSALDRYFIQHYSGDASAGSYAAMSDVIVRSFSLLCFPLVLSSNSLVMSRWNKNDRRGAVSVIGSSLKYQIAISIFFFFALALLTRQVSHVILGRQFETNASLVLPLALGGFLWQISYLLHKPLELLCRTKRMLAAMIVALAVSVIGNYLLIPVYGYLAAAYVAIAAPVAYLIVVLGLTPMGEFRRAISVPVVPVPVEDIGD